MIIIIISIIIISIIIICIIIISIIIIVIIVFSLIAAHNQNKVNPRSAKKASSMQYVRWKCGTPALVCPKHVRMGTELQH